MKKALAYAATAILLGAAIMLTPWMLVKQGSYALMDSDDKNVIPCFSGGGEEILSGQEALVKMTSPPNLLSAGLLLIPSLLLALGVSLYLKKRMF